MYALSDTLTVASFADSSLHANFQFEQTTCIKKSVRLLSHTLASYSNVSFFILTLYKSAPSAIIDKLTN